MVPAAIALEGAVQSGGSDPAVEFIVLDDDVATFREVPPAVVAAISAASVTGNIGSVLSR
jgi:hypothetical protein